MSQEYIATLPHMQSKIGHWEGFVFDDNVWLVADWRQGMLAIGSTPDPGALHLTQGVVRVVLGGQFYIFYYSYTHKNNGGVNLRQISVKFKSK